MPHHIIHKQKVNIKTDISSDAFALQNRISNLFKNDLKNKLEFVFNKISPNGKILRIDKLELDIGTISKKNLESEFSSKLIEQLSAELSNLHDITNEIAQHRSMIDALVYFLQNGYLPWYSSVRNFLEWETEMLTAFNEEEWSLLIDSLKKSVYANQNIIRRLVMQFSEPFLDKILFKINNDLNKNWQEKFLKDPDKTKYFFWQETITSALITSNQNDFESELTRKLNSKEEASIDKLNSKENKKEKLLVDEEFFTNNCGIVILHPFLQMYFQELELLNENDFKNVESQQRAVLLLHYLATGETNVAEFNLLLAKLLCNIEFDESVPNFIELTEKEKTESDNILKAVTQHWKPLNNTSAEGLQSSFFQREGKLMQTETGWLLKVEQKTIDILLNKLPWGIGTIKLPWMKNTLNVEWF